MATILINGLKAKTGGGRSILSNYLSLLQGAQVNHRYLVLTPAREEYLRYESGNVSVIDVPGIFKANLFFPILYSLIFPQLIRRHGINLIFNLGDVVIPTRTRQVYLFDWAYAIYPESITWDRMGWRERMIRRIKVAFIRRWFGCATATIAQTDIARDRLKSLFGLDLVEVIPNAVSLENLGRGDAREFALPTGRRLLYLTYYYSHKNIEILIPVARLIREKGLDFKIVVTLDPRQGPGAAAFLEAISREGLDGIVVNVGLVPAMPGPADAYPAGIIFRHLRRGHVPRTRRFHERSGFRPGGMRGMRLVFQPPGRRGYTPDRGRGLLPGRGV
jgi:glycosyltransferase involved in cell wall biosynthesis